MTQTTNPQSENLDRGWNFGTLQFPADLFSEQNSKAITFYVYRFRKSSVLEPEKSDALKAIAMPLPTNLSDSIQVDYEVNSLLFAETAVNVSGFKEGIGAANQLAAATFRDKFRDINQALGKPEVTNPRNVNRFKDVGFKSHQFDFTLVSRNSTDSQNIQNIINTFRYYMVPEIKNATTFLHPEIFIIEFLPEELNRTMYRPAPSALVSLNVTYNGSNTPTFFKDTLAPVEIVISLGFQELQIETKETIRQKYGYQE